MSQSSSTGFFKVMRASAGSGKTYSLVREYLRLMLQSNAADYYKHILAITFTNAAAAEMKSRVIEQLHRLAMRQENVQVLCKELADDLGVSTEVVQSRSKAAYQHILHNYGQLSVQTIDGFTHKLIRTFARELKLNQEFSIEMDSDRFYELVVDRSLEELGHESEFTNYLEQLALDSLEEGEGWNVRKYLLKMCQQLTREETLVALRKLNHLSLSDFSSIHATLQKRRKSFEQVLKALGEQGMELMRKHALVPEDFFHGKTGGMVGIRKLANEIYEYPSARFFGLLEGAWYSKTADQSVVERIERLRPEMEPVLTRIVESYQSHDYQQYMLTRMILPNLRWMALLNYLNEKAEAIKQDQNILLISDFHRLVNEVVRESPAPYIYERVGTRYKHILIDEFQDTSTLQWANAIPLIQNTLGENQLNLLVGDAKQSIYRWRGGRVEQFVNLPEVTDNSQFIATTTFFKSHFQLEVLDKNYRSSRSVIDFNNKLYRALVTGKPDLERVYDRLEQLPVKEKEGFVCVDVVDAENKEEAWSVVLSQIETYVHGCIADGYLPSDIAILTRKGNSEGGVIAEYLKDKGFEVQTQGSFLLINSAAVRAIMAFLEFYDDRQKHFAAIDCVHALSFLNPKLSVEHFAENYIIKAGKNRQIKLMEYLTSFYPQLAAPRQQTSVYRMVVNTIKLLNLPLDKYMECLLDHVQDKIHGRGMSLSQLMEWWRSEREKLYIETVNNDNAIRIMTIHKSKGLQFPVVIYPRLGNDNNQQNLWINVDEEIYGLSTALVQATSSKANPGFQIPDEMEEEIAMSKLDQLNICYVATTRAEDRLYLINTTGKRSSELSKEIATVMERDFSENKSGNHWELGSAQSVNQRKQTRNTTVIEAVQNEVGAIKMIPANASEDWTEEIAHGNLLHKILAEVSNHTSWEDAVNRVTAMSGLSEKALNELRIEVKSLVEHPEWSHWFNTNKTVFAERSIATPQGWVFRPDRVLVSENEVQVIDFKSGKPFEKYHQQLRKYMACLKDMYKKPVRGYILYTQTKTVEEVTSD